MFTPNHLHQILQGQRVRARPFRPPGRRARPAGLPGRRAHPSGSPGYEHTPGQGFGFGAVPQEGGILEQILGNLHHAQPAPGGGPDVGGYLPASAYGFQSSMPQNLAGYPSQFPDSALGMEGGAAPGPPDYALGPPGSPPGGLPGAQQGPGLLGPPIHHGRLMPLPRSRGLHARPGNQDLLRTLGKHRAVAAAMKHMQRLHNHPALRRASYGG